VANTLLFGAFAFMALREVGGRWEKLGDQPADLAAAPDGAPEGFPQSNVKLVTLSGQQRAVDMYKPQSTMLTTSMELFSVAALEAAERQREQHHAAAGLPANSPPRVSADSQRRGLDVLFSLAASQRAALAEPREHPAEAAVLAESQARQPAAEEPAEEPAEAEGSAEPVPTDETDATDEAEEAQEAAHPEEGRPEVAEALPGKDAP
jgi:hypothetical protein